MKTAVIILKPINFDANIDNYPYDYIIENTILEELDKRALDFVDEINNKSKKFTLSEVNN